MIHQIYLILLLSILRIGLMHAQSPGQYLQHYYSTHHTEKLYAHTDKQYYLPEETIYGKIYHVHGHDHQLLDTSVLVHVELWDSSAVLIQNLIVRTSEGQAAFSLDTSLDYESGPYTLKVYTQYQKNFPEEYIFQKQILIITNPNQQLLTLDQSEDVSIEFFPEGGYLIEGVLSTVAYRMKGIQDENTEPKAIIIDSDGDTIVSFSPVINGYGTFSLSPAPDQDYIVHITDGSRSYTSSLPNRLSSGVALQMDQRDSIISISCNLSHDLNGKDIYIAGHIRGAVFLDASMTRSTVYKLNRSELPSGILHFTLFDGHMYPIAERLVFNSNPIDSTTITFQIDHTKISSRSQITAKLQADYDQKINGSVSIYSDELLDRRLRGIDIKSYLLLQSDLRGRINNIADFISVDESGDSHVDLLMLTHGWRRFDWQEVLLSRQPYLNFPAETSSIIAGKVRLLRNNKPTKSDVLLTILNEDQFVYQKITTDSDGLFFFSGLEFKDSTDVIIQASKHRKKKKSDPDKLDVNGNRLVKVELFELNEPSIDINLDLPILTFQPPPNSGRLLSESNKVAQMNNEVISNQSSIFEGAIWSIDIENVTVSASVNRAQKRNLETRRRYREKNMVFFSSTEKFNPNEEQYESFDYKNIYHMISNIIPSIDLSYNAGIPQLNNGVAQIFLDGNLVAPERALLINPADISMIDHWVGDLKPYVVYGVNEAVVLLSKNQEDIINSVKKGVAVFSFPGYHQAKTYSSPDHSMDYINESDLRTTLFWDADVQLNGSPYEIDFVTSDIIGDFVLSFEGISQDGVPFSEHYNFTVTQ